MIELGTKFAAATCSKCKHESCTMIFTEVVDFGTKLRKTVFDACPKCGKKLTSETEFLRDLTDDEVKELFNSKGKINENKRRNPKRSGKP